MQQLILGLIYLIFFLSGSAALIYEVLWVRYLSIVFGGSHLAVTTVLAVFMGGLALGSYGIGKRAGNYKNLLRLYGFLELGIAASALVFMALMHFYPALYVPLARIAEDSPVYLSFIRVAFAAVALIVPTMLMGGTLPVLSSFISGRAKALGSRFSFLYGFNTLGAVFGSAVAGFYLLPHYSVSASMITAALINVLVGVLGIVLQVKVQTASDAAAAGGKTLLDADMPSHTTEGEPENLFATKLVLWGIGISGFCALAYEVLWTRILSIVIGASVYGFTLLLISFLAGIGLGSAAYGLYQRLTGRRRMGAESHSLRPVIGFGLVQIIIGLSALFVTIHLRDLASHAVSVYDFIHGIKLRIGSFKTRQLANFVVAFSFLFVPAFFMGVAFPLAGKIHAQYKKVVGKAVGEILSYNTIGAILGSAISGFVLIYLLGIQQSLKMVILINIGLGLLVMVSVMGRRLLNLAVSGAVMIVGLILVLHPDFGKLWDTKYYAVYQSNHPEMYSSPEKAREVLANTDVLYYGEGIQAIVSSIRSGEAQFFVTNGRVEASNSNEGMQCQYTLGHLPMLLNRNPRKVFVLGTGSGMTLGATSVHPSVKQITLAEIEPKVLGVARTFGIYNHYVMDNPKLRIVFNDGRNFLLTTKEKFDVITADPIHPWFSGAGYLYSTEYFKLAADHLNPGGMVCQWLPIYELSEANLKSVVKTFHKNFPYIMIWLTYDDAELVGSNLPIIIDEKELERRIKVPEVLQDLERVKMGSAENFLSYFVMDTQGAEAYSYGGRINTDDNLYLEFSAPHSIGETHLMGDNVYTLVKNRESILPYLRSSIDQATSTRQTKIWEKNLLAADLYDKAHVMHLAGRSNTPEYEKLSLTLDAHYPTYAPWRFLRDERPDTKGGKLKLLKQIELALINEKGELTGMTFSAVIIRSNKERARVFFVENSSRIVFGKLRVRGANKEAYISNFVEDLIKSVQDLYKEESRATHASGKAYPSATSMLPKIKHLVEVKIDEAKM